jgi:dTDP-4-amino-4,6-dideoxygalactose transaminase
VVTSDPELAARIQVLRDHGQESKYHHSVVGWNGRMDGIQAAVLSVKLRHLEKGNSLRQGNADLYGMLLAQGDDLILPVKADYSSHVFHLYVVRVKERDGVLQSLGARGISCGIHYPKPVHLQKAYANLGLVRGSLPVTEVCADEVLSLPMFPELGREQIEAVARELNFLLPAADGRKAQGA